MTDSVDTDSGRNGGRTPRATARLAAAQAEQSNGSPVGHDSAVDDRPPVPAIRYRAAELPRLILDRAALPWISLRVGGDRAEIVRARAGQVVVLTAASGAGKSSLAIEWAWRHAADHGPAVYVSVELDADEIAGRIVGQRCAAAWPDVLTARVTEEEMTRALDLARLVVLDDDRATLDAAGVAVTALRSEFPDQPVLVVVDYLSILRTSADGAIEHRDERIRVAGVAERIRRWAKAVGAVVVAISQTSRAIAGALRRGEVSGADTASTGAESAQVERMAALTVAIGNPRDLDDGTTAVDVSVGKGRMGQGDRVIPVLFDGRTGAWRVTGAAKSGAEHKATQASAKEATAVRTAGLAIVAHVDASPVPLSRNAIQTALGQGRDRTLAAIRSRLASGELVEVAGKKTGGAWPLWTRRRADAEAVQVVPREMAGA